MSTFYVGYRNVLKGRSSQDAVNPRTGEKAVYSNYSLYNTSNVLDGMPDRAVKAGDGRRYGGAQLSAYLFAGRSHVAPMANAGNKTKADYDLYKWQGVPSAKILGDAGHTARNVSWSLYSNYIYDGAVAQPLADAGHTYRKRYYGPITPYINKGVGQEPLEDAGQSTDGDKPLEWFGVPSAKAL